MKQSSCIGNVYQTCQKVELSSYMYGSRSRACAEDLMNRIPEGCIAKIFSYLEKLEDWQSCATVCWSWADILVSERPGFWGPFSARQAVHPCLRLSDVVDTKLVAAVVGIQTRDVVTGLDLQCAPGDAVVAGVPQLTDKGINFVTCACRNLKSIRLVNCLSLTNEVARIIASNCPALEDLVIVQCPISDGGLSQFAKQCKNLKSLHIEGSLSITEASLGALVKYAKRLESLTLGSCPQIGEDAILSFLTGKHYLDKLVLIGMLPGGSHLNDARESSALDRRFSSFRQVCSLILVKCPGLQDRSMLEFSTIQFGGLQHLVIDDCQGVTQHGLMQLAGGMNPMRLKTIKLARFHFFTLRALIEVMYLLSETIESVILDSCDFDIVMQYNLGGTVPWACRALKVIRVENCGSIVEPFLIWLSGVCRGLKELSLIGGTGPVWDYALLMSILKCGILHHNAITKIELRSCDITDLHVFIIFKTCLETLQELILDDSPKSLTYSALFIRQCPNLVKLRLSRLQIDDQYILTVMRPGFEHLEEVNLMGCPRITDMALHSLASLTSSSMLLPRLSRVLVSGCPRITQRTVEDYRRIWEMEG